MLEELYAPEEESGEGTAEGAQETEERNGEQKDSWSMEEEIGKAEEALSGSGVE